MRLEGKVAVITGAGSGIGFAAAELFSREEASVVCLDIRQSHQLRMLVEDRRKIVFKQTDVSNEEDVREALDHCVSTFGRVDVLFNNAGFAVQGATGELTQEEWDDVFSVNVRGVFFGTKHVLPHMVRQGGGSIVNTASTFGLIAQPKLAVYCASKSAVIGLTRQTALDYARYAIRCNCICPGPTRTPNIEKHYGLPDNLTEKGRYLVSTVPMERLAEPSEIATAVLFLSSDESSFVTGAALVVDGGQSIHTGSVWREFDSPYGTN